MIPMRRDPLKRHDDGRSGQKIPSASPQARAGMKHTAVCYTVTMVSGDTPHLIEALKKQAGEEKRLPCAEAFRIAHDLEVPVAQVGKACNDIGIKIMGCQLGCF
jgi:hypothetical protein